MSAVSRMPISRQSGRLPREDQNHQPRPQCPCWDR